MQSMWACEGTMLLVSLDQRAIRKSGAWWKVFGYPIGLPSVCQLVSVDER
jgi:hypothetical protein